MIIFHHKLLTIEGPCRVVDQRSNSSIIHVNICIRKKYHPKSYLSDIKYHMILNIIFNVVSPHGIVRKTSHPRMFGGQIKPLRTPRSMMSEPSTKGIKKGYPQIMSPEKWAA